MAKGPRTNRTADHADFSGPDADKANIERLAAAAKEANAKTGHNGGEPLDEVIKRNADAIEVALIEIDTAMRTVQAARAGLAAAQKTAKTDLGSKEWVESVKAAVKLKRAAAKGGLGSIVSEHRKMGRVLRLLDTPLGVQYNLFAVPADVDAEPGKTSAMDAELQGDAAWRNNEPESNNPFQAGTENHVLWQQGFRTAMAVAANKMGPGNGEPTH